jgi:hypothetical protein
MKLLASFLLSAFAICANAQMPLRFDYPSNQIERVQFWLESCEHIDGTNWQTVAFLIPTTNTMQFYRVGVQWADVASVPVVTDKPKGLHFDGSKTGKL